MRRVLLLLVSLLLAGCQLNEFVTRITGETTVPGSASAQTTELAALPPFGEFSEIDFASNPDLAREGVSLADINKATVSALTLQIESPSDQDFGFLDDVAFYAKTGDQKVLVAEKHEIAKLGLGGRNPTLELDVTGADLTPFVTAASMSLLVEGHGRTPLRDVKLKANVDFEIRVKVF